MPEKSVAKVQRFLTSDGANCLDNILDEVGAPANPELVSIDIDGDDLAIWRGLTRHRPQCVVIEYNPTIPFDCFFENPRGVNWGNSARSIVALAYDKEYLLIAVTGTNLIFLDSKGPLSASGLNSIDLTDVPAGPRYFWGYDGTFLIVSSADDGSEKNLAPEFFKVPWAGTDATQPIPRRLRGYHDRTSAKTRGRSALASVTAVAIRPISAIGEMRKRIRRR